MMLDSLDIGNQPDMAAPLSYCPTAVPAAQEPNEFVA